MINIFRKRKLIKDDDYTLLSFVVKNLPSKYSFLIKQVSKNFILDKKVNELGDKGTYRFVLNADLEPIFSSSNYPQFFIIKNIIIWNKAKQSKEFIEIHILEGMIAGYRLNAKFSDLDFTKSDFTKVSEKHFINEDKEVLKKIIGKVDDKILSNLDLKSTFKIVLSEDHYYVIKNLGDGNYISLNEKGEIFGMIHDPYEIEKLYDSKESFFEALKLGNFDFNQYCESKIK